MHQRESQNVREGEARARERARERESEREKESRGVHTRNHFEHIMLTMSICHAWLSVSERERQRVSECVSV